MTKNRTVIVFDFDGVIADSLHIAFEVNRLSKPTLTLERYKAGFNGNINEVTYEDKVVKEIDFFKEYGNRFATLGIDEGKKEIIKKLAEQFPLYIISSTTSDIISDYLKRHDLLPCFTRILGNEIHASKVKKFQLLCTEHAITPTDIIFITDSVGDINEAREAGVNTIVGMLGGYQDEEHIIQAEPTILVNTFAQFYDFVQGSIKDAQ